MADGPSITAREQESGEVLLGIPAGRARRRSDCARAVCTVGVGLGRGQRRSGTLPLLAVSPGRRMVGCSELRELRGFRVRSSDQIRLVV